MRVHLFAFTLVAALTGANRVAATKPHILYILADDFGWGDADWHKPEGWNESATPNMMKEIAQGIQLDNMYSFKFCAPTRSSIQSGRNPIHVNVQNYQPVVYDVEHTDPVSGYAGIPTKMTGISAVLKQAGYSTHFAGKWDCGMATEAHTPRGRGYDTSLFYFHHDNDYWQDRVRLDDRMQKCPGQSKQFVDLWDDDKPAHGLNGAAECVANKMPYPTLENGDPNTDCVYEDFLFYQRVMQTVEAHNTSDGSAPLFFFWAAHTIHAPLQVPKPFYDKYAAVDWEPRRKYLAMVNWLDTAVGNVTGLLRQRGMWDNTLVVFSSDNGGPVYGGGSAGANNFPLRGGKASNFQGGIRVNAWVGGGVIPHAMRGVTLAGLTCVWDMYATFASVGGVADYTDHQAAAAGLPPIDSLDMWPYWSGAAAASPRSKLAVGSTTCEQGTDADCVNAWGWGDVKTTVQAIIQDRGEGGLWKLLLGGVPYNGWQGPYYPNASSPTHAFLSVLDCGLTGCLFRLDEDPTEHNDLVQTEPAIAAELLAALKSLNATTFSPYRGKGEATQNISVPCDAAENKYGGFYGPFLGV